MSIFHDSELVDNIRKAKQPIKIATNAGSRAVFSEANVEGFGTVWYDEKFKNCKGQVYHDESLIADCRSGQ